MSSRLPNAAKTVFPFALILSVCLLAHADSPVARNEGLSLVRWSDAQQVVGSLAVVSGKIVSVGKFGRVHFLNFDRSRRDVFKVVIFEENLDRFDKPLRELYGKKLVLVRGVVTLYKGVPQIQVVSMDQIAVVDSLPPSKIVERPIRQVGRQIKVATYNIRNLFDDVDDPYHMDETTAAKPRSELTRVAATIKAIDADVLALQEVENRGYLQHFVDAFLREMAYEIVHFAGNDIRGSDLALLTRIPVGAVTSHRHRRFPNDAGVYSRFSRDLLCAQLLPTVGKSFEVWVTHLKSKREGHIETEPQRLAEAGEIRRLLDRRLEQDREARIIVVGDFNDTLESRPVQRLIGDGPYRLQGFWQDAPPGAVTYNLEPHREMIDFIFCTPAAAESYLAESYRIVDANLEQSGSDHNPVMAEFRF